MPRRSRIVIPSVPHHVTQRGSRRQDVFFCSEDRQVYLDLLKVNAEKYGVHILVYTLMTNHVHHLVVPLEIDSLRWTFQMTHKRYADYINKRSDWSGHLWQERFYSSAVDLEYFWVTTRYILRNPVLPGLVHHPLDYEWSSAKANAGLCENSLLSSNSKWMYILKERTNWREWLGTQEDATKIALLKKRTAQDLPIGSEEFLANLEKDFHIEVHPSKMGRPKKEKS